MWNMAGKVNPVLPLVTNPLPEWDALKSLKTSRGDGDRDPRGIRRGIRRMRSSSSSGDGRKSGRRRDSPRPCRRSRWITSGARWRERMAAAAANMPEYNMRSPGEWLNEMHDAGGKAVKEWLATARDRGGETVRGAEENGVVPVWAARRHGPLPVHAAAS